MSLQFIAGGSGSGKTRYLYEKVLKESQEHPEIQYLFIVPEQYTMQTQKELVRLHPRHGLLNIDVLSFKRLAYRVFEDLGVQLPVVLDDMGKSMVIRKVAGKLKKDLNLYGGHLEQPGFISQLNPMDIRTEPVWCQCGRSGNGGRRDGQNPFKRKTGRFKEYL